MGGEDAEDGEASQQEEDVAELEHDLGGGGGEGKVWDPGWHLQGGVLLRRGNDGVEAS